MLQKSKTLPEADTGTPNTRQMALAGLVGAGILTRRLSLHPDLRLPLALLFIIYLCLPRLMFASFGADRRLLVMVALATVAALHLRIDTWRVRGILATGVVMLFLERMTVIGMNWINADKVYAPILSGIERLPHGARVAVICGGDSFPYLANPPLDHVPNTAVITKDAYLHTLFAEPGRQVLEVVHGSTTPCSVDSSQTFRMGPEEKGRADPFSDLPPERFDFVMLINPDYFSHDYPARFAPVYEKENVMLFKISPQKGS